MADDGYTIRTMRPEEVAIAVQWAAREGWNPGVHDAECYCAADPDGFLVGLDRGDPVATISAVRYGDDFGFIGFYIVRPDRRGNGFGLRIWQAALDHLGGRLIGLDGVVAQQHNYRKSGFSLAHRNIRYEGAGLGGHPDDADIVELHELPLETVLSYDRPFFPAERSAFIRAWITQPGSSALGIRRNGALAGYGVVRACRSGCKIGPLFADDAVAAEALFTALASRAKPSDPVYLDVPQVNEAAMDLARRHGMRAAFETARMYTGEAPAIPLDRIFGVTSFEVG